MIPVLYQKDEINFTSNGLGRLVDIIDISVDEELNSSYTIEFVYPVDGHLFDYMIKNGGVVFTTHDEKGDFQAFDITGHTTTLDGRVTFMGEHIRYRLKNYVVKPFTASSCAAAGAGIMSNALPRNNPFSFWTDKATTGNFKLEVPQVAVSLLGGVQGSLLDVYGHGEYVFDMFDVKLYATRGIETGATIRYGKNMIDLTREYDESDIYSAVAPYWSKEGVTVYTPDLYVLSSNGPTEKMVWTEHNGVEITDNNGQNIEFQYAKIIPRPLNLTDKFSEAPTQQQLIDAATEFMNSNRPWVPNENIEVDFVALWQSPEYESVAALQRFSLGDKVSVYYPEVNLICENKQVIRVVYDPLNERYKSMEIGKLKSSLSEAIMDSSENDIRDIVEEYIPTSSALDKAIAHATQLISGGLGGHVVLKTNANGEPEELLIMDTDDINTAVNVWRFNQGGLGHSHSGYDGPYNDVALTMDGRINANLITAGQMNANYIHGGTLSLGGQDNQSGIWVVNDENGNEIARGDKDGVTSKALTATKYVYLNGDPGSYFKMPLSNTSPADYYILISNSGSNLPVEIRGQVYSGGGYKKIGSFIDGSGITIKYDINQNTSQIWSNLTANGLSLSKNGGSDAADYGVSAIHLQNGDISISAWDDAYYGRNYEVNLGGVIDISSIEDDGSGSPIVQVFLDGGSVTAGIHIAQGQAYLALGSTVLTEAKLQQLLALI